MPAAAANAGQFWSRSAILPLRASLTAGASWAPSVTTRPLIPMARPKRTRSVVRCYREVDSDDEMSDVSFRLSRSDDDGYQTDLTEPSVRSAHSSKTSRRGQPRLRGSTCVSSTDSDREGIGGSDPFHWPDNGDLDDTDENLSDVPSDFGGSDATKALRHRVVDRWKLYCARKARRTTNPKWNCPKEALRQASANDVHLFFNWVLGKLKRGKKGRRLPGIKVEDSLNTDWKYFSGYYKKETGGVMSEKMRNKILNGKRYLAEKYGLRKQPRDNAPVYIEDMVPYNETILQTQEKRFHLGLQRLLLCFYNMLGLFTVNRKTAILQIQYKDLKLSVQRNPHGGPPVPTVDFTPTCIKNKFGMKKLNTFILPEIIYGISLVFSPHVFLFGFLFHAEAFENPTLQTMDDVRRLLPAAGCQELELPLKQEMDEWYLFPKVVVVGGQVRILRDTPMTLGSNPKITSEIHGWLNPFYTHQFRHGGGKLLDESGFVSGPQMNVIMNHASINTFIKHYRIRRHANLQEVMCGLDPDREWERALTGQNRLRDQRRPRHLTAAEKDSVEQMPELQALIRTHQEMRELLARTGDPALQLVVSNLGRDITNTRQRLRYKLRNEVRQGFSRKQAVVDIERQLSGTAIHTEPAQQPSDRVCDIPPEQMYLLECLMSVPASDLLDDEWQRRNKAVEAVRQYCDFLEGGPLRGRLPQEAPDGETKIVRECPPSALTRNDQSRAPVEHIRDAPKPEACFQCRKQYTRYADVLRHFRSAHLNDRQCNFSLIPECILQYNVQKSRDVVLASLFQNPRILDYDILAIQEPWRNPFINTSYHPLKAHFQLMYLADATTRVCLYINKKINPSTWSVSFVSGDIISLQITNPCSGNKVSVFNIYNKPGRNTLLTLGEAIRELDSQQEIVVLGDFNLHHPLWMLAPPDYGSWKWLTACPTAMMPRKLPRLIHGNTPHNTTPTPGSFGYSPNPFYSHSPSPSLQPRLLNQLGFVPFAAWEETGEYIEQLLKYVYYTVEWQLNLNHRKTGRVTKKDVVLAPSDYWEEFMKAELENMLQTKRKHHQQAQSEGTTITVSVNDQTQGSLEKFCPSTNIDWTPVEKQLHKWSNLLHIGKQLKVTVVFNYRQEDDDSHPPLGGADKRGQVSASRRMLAEHQTHIEAEEERTGQPSTWNLVYEAMQCRVHSCPLKSDWCWEDPGDKKHYKLRAPHFFWAGI
ncbi:hypothetical protein ACJ73_08084 [Blastomyces percursus]|uniref:C2H2-type domain-containing protein n=1 Tax=Blastomyces percursus TaxID=1658174 RepID=A0A1J9QZ47_9EURO|nr:hypothetical protein ACJ73_08084 [Blastomyces percursus]